ASIGRELAATDIPEMCLTCAFREGCMTNKMAATGIVALNCVLGVDKDAFACHHGMRDGQPSRLCAGYLAAKHVPSSAAKELLSDIYQTLVTQGGPDTEREAFNAWLDEVDPHRVMDDYQLARLYAHERGGA